jgi:anthranilate phosphoribosyltransferase
MIKEAIYKLINHKDLTYEESLAVMGEMMDGTATQAQMGGFLTALRMQGETIDEITAFATIMREKGVKLHPERDVMEIVGTGGDEVGTFNIFSNGKVSSAARARAFSFISSGETSFFSSIRRSLVYAAICSKIIN